MTGSARPAVTDLPRRLAGLADDWGRGRLAIVADDLTGAADAAAPFADRGAEVSLVLTWPPEEGVDVLACVTDSRWRDEACAAQRVRDSVGRARSWGARRLFVKVDSTLRGNVHSEVGGALRAWGGQTAVAAPAFPAQGRVVRNGVLHVHGQPQTPPVRSLFPEEVDVVDAETDDDLRRVAERIVRSGAVAVGSAGLARALAVALAPRSRAPRRPSSPVTGVLVVVGTGHPVSRGQAEALLLTGTARLVLSRTGAVQLEPAVAALTNGGRVLVTAEVDGSVEPDSPEAQALATPLARIVRDLVLDAPGTALVLTGGATALAVADELGAHALRLLGELTPGIAVGELLVGKCQVPTITKSGGFGRPDTLVRAAEFLEQSA